MVGQELILVLWAIKVIAIHFRSSLSAIRIIGVLFMLHEIRILKPNKDGTLHQIRHITKEEVTECYWKNVNGDKLSERICVECGIPFEGPKRQTICTPKCKEERALKRIKKEILHRKEKRKLIPRMAERECKSKHCNVIFTPKRNNNVFHHPKCRDKDYVRKCRTCKKEILTNRNRLYCYAPCLPKNSIRKDRKKHEY